MVMIMYKINSSEDDQIFVVTNAYRELYKIFKSLKMTKGRIIHVIGAPGTGKSANIYNALNGLEMNIYDAILLMDHVNKNSREVFKEFFNTLKEDMDVDSYEKIYLEASKYDLVLFADKFHDSEFIDKNKIGLSMWTDHKGIRTFPFYLLVIIEYIKHKKYLKDVNIVLQTAWTVRIKGVKYDLFTDFGPLSKIMKGALRLLFEVVEISYCESEVIEIVKNRFQDVNEDIIRSYIQKYGNKPRFILEALEWDFSSEQDLLPND